MSSHNKTDIKSATGDTPHDSKPALHESISDYVNAVCRQIRWKMARVRVSEELTSHIEDSRDAYISQGLCEAEAIANAIANTGDADVVGTQLDRVHRPKPQWGMLGTTAALTILGLAVYVFFAGGLSANRLIFTGIGVAGLVAAYFIDFTWLAKYPVPMFFTALAASLAIPYARRRFGWPAILFDPTRPGLVFFSFTDAVILILPLVLAVVIFHAKSRGYRGLIFCGISFAVLVMAAFGISFGGAARFIVIGIILLGIAIVKGLFLVKKLPAALVVFGPLMLLGLPVMVVQITNFHCEKCCALLKTEEQPRSAGFIRCDAKLCRANV